MPNQHLKQFSKSDLLGFAGAVFMDFCPPEGDLTKKLYRHKVKDFLIRISFGICSKLLLTMRNRFLILPKRENLVFNEFLKLELQNLTFLVNIWLTVFYYTGRLFFKEAKYQAGFLYTRLHLYCN